MCMYCAILAFFSYCPFSIYLCYLIACTKGKKMYLYLGLLKIIWGDACFLAQSLCLHMTWSYGGGGKWVCFQFSHMFFLFYIASQLAHTHWWFYSEANNAIVALKAAFLPTNPYKIWSIINPRWAEIEYLYYLWPCKYVNFQNYPHLLQPLYIPLYGTTHIWEISFKEQMAHSGLDMVWSWFAICFWRIPFAPLRVSVENLTFPL